MVHYEILYYSMDVDRIFSDHVVTQPKFRLLLFNIGEFGDILIFQSLVSLIPVPYTYNNGLHTLCYCKILSYWPNFRNLNIVFYASVTCQSLII